MPDATAGHQLCRAYFIAIDSDLSRPKHLHPGISSCRQTTSRTTRIAQPCLPYIFTASTVMARFLVANRFKHITGSTGWVHAVTVSLHGNAIHILVHCRIGRAGRFCLQLLGIASQATIKRSMIRSLCWQCRKCGLRCTRNVNTIISHSTCITTWRYPAHTHTIDIQN